MIEDKKISNIDFRQQALEDEYNNCTFINCNFSEMQIKEVVFEDCKFELCNFSLAKMDAFWRDVQFKECKLTGANFTKINKFSTFSFQQSNLQYAIFVKTKLKCSKFTSCNLQEVDFSQADLTMSIFKDCDMLRTVFSNTNLEKADLTTSYNYIIDPNNNTIRKARFSKYGLSGLLIPFGIIIEDVD
ncbi:MAG: Pentapeptide repeat (8 copies) [Bacteroidetes bacterium]|nr:Pentapeptide repeat (8 copies) [Bacteroidota bacterium]